MAPSFVLFFELPLACKRDAPKLLRLKHAQHAVVMKQQLVDEFFSYLRLQFEPLQSENRIQRGLCLNKFVIRDKAEKNYL